MGDTQDVGLNFLSSFSATAMKDAAAADEMSAAFGRVAAAGQKMSNFVEPAAAKFSAVTAELNQQVALEAKIATFDASRVKKVAELEAQYKKMHDAATGADQKDPVAAALPKGGLDSISGAILPGAEKLGTSAGLASAAGGAIAAGAAKLLSAAVELGKSAASLAVAGFHLAVAETTEAEIQGEIFKQLGGDYDASVKTILKLGIDKDAGVAEVKKLLNAKFSKEEIPLLLKIKAGMDLADLDGSALLKKLESINLGGKVGAKDIDGLKKLGVDSQKVYEELARVLHTDVAGAMAKVKSGAVDAKTATAAIEKVAEGQFGKLAETAANSVPALLATMTDGFKDLFSFDASSLDPMKDAIRAVTDALGSDAGAELKDGLKDLFDVAVSFFKSVDKETISEAFSKGANAAHELAGGLEKAKPLITAIAGFAFKEVVGGVIVLGHVLRGAGIIFETVSEAIEAVSEYLDELDQRFEKAKGTVDAFEESLASLSIDSVAESLMHLVDSALDLVSGIFATAVDIGAQMAAGLAEGIANGASGAIDAAGNMAAQALAKAKAVLDQHSPSGEFAEVGHFSSEGMAKGMAANDNATAAAGDMATRALGAASAVSGGAGAAGAAGGAAAGGAAGVVFNINIGAGPNAAATAAAVKVAIAEELPKIEAMLRRVARDKQEAV